MQGRSRVVSSPRGLYCCQGTFIFSENSVDKHQGESKILGPFRSYRRCGLTRHTQCRGIALPRTACAPSAGQWTTANSTALQHPTYIRPLQQVSPGHDDPATWIYCMSDVRVKKKTASVCLGWPLLLANIVSRSVLTFEWVAQMSTEIWRLLQPQHTHMHPITHDMCLHVPWASIQDHSNC